MKLNCWEFKKCGREPGGAHVSDLGTCRAAVDQKWNGKNNGINAGRTCWTVVGTFCGGPVQGTFAQKMETCVGCDFLKLVREEEGIASRKPGTTSPDFREHP